MNDPAEALRAFAPSKEFFIGIDSDGCVFDSMEIKHKECFAPMFIKHHSLQAVSKYAREVWEIVNLYSKTRGCNRFHALLRALELLRDRREVQARSVVVPSYPALEEWVQRESKLGHATLDVFREEPLPSDHPFWNHPRVTVTHNNAAITEAKSATRIVAENIRRLGEGRPLLNLVDRTAGY